MRRVPERRLGTVGGMSLAATARIASIAEADGRQGNGPRRIVFGECVRIARYARERMGMGRRLSECHLFGRTIERTLLDNWAL